MRRYCFEVIVYVVCDRLTLFTFSHVVFDNPWLAYCVLLAIHGISTILFYWYFSIIWFFITTIVLWLFLQWFYFELRVFLHFIDVCMLYIIPLYVFNQCGLMFLLFAILDSLKMVNPSGCSEFHVEALSIVQAS